MKFPCTQCGIHFKQDFDLTLAPPCNVWGDMGMANLPVELKRKMWDWIFSLPTDEIAILAGYGLWLQIGSTPINKATLFENAVPGYKEWPEEKQQEYQRKYYKAKKDGTPIPEPDKVKERMVN